MFEPTELPMFTALQPSLVLPSVLALGLLFYLARIGHRQKSLPPGPPTVPLFGNDLALPTSDAHFAMTKWAKEFGGIFSLKRFSGTIIVLSDWGYVKSLLDKRSSKYSHRPKSIVSDMITGGHHILMMEYDDSWRAVRKLIHQTLMESRCDKEHFRLQEAEANQMLYDFMTNPGENMLHPKRYSNSITMSIVFGWRTKSPHNDYLTRLYEILEKWSMVMELGSTPPIDSFSFLKWIPELFLSRWKTRVTECRDMMNGLYFEVLQCVIDRRRNGIRKNSLMDQVLDAQEKYGFSDHQLAFMGGSMMEGGSDTSSSLILAIIQAMTLYPDVLKKAQHEIDAVVGSERSPTWSDHKQLPYINMIIKEAHRWRPVLPLGAVHSIREDDEIDGMTIPSDSTIILNVWALHHDEKRWKSPEDFIPERYAAYPALAPVYAASKDFADRDHLGYGASRRICPAIHLAERNLFIATAKLLWAFDITADPDAIPDGNANTGSSTGFMQCVKDYGCKIQIRSEAKRITVGEEFLAAREVFKAYE